MQIPTPPGGLRGLLQQQQPIAPQMPQVKSIQDEIAEYIASVSGDPEYRKEYDTNQDGQITMQDVAYAGQFAAGTRDPETLQPIEPSAPPRIPTPIDPGPSVPIPDVGVPAPIQPIAQPIGQEPQPLQPIGEGTPPPMQIAPPAPPPMQPAPQPLQPLQPVPQPIPQAPQPLQPIEQAPQPIPQAPLPSQPIGGSEETLRRGLLGAPVSNEDEQRARQIDSLRGQIERGEIDIPVIDGFPPLPDISTLPEPLPKPEPLSPLERDKIDAGVMPGPGLTPIMPTDMRPSYTLQTTPKEINPFGAGFSPEEIEASRRRKEEDARRIGGLTSSNSDALSARQGATLIEGPIDNAMADNPFRTGLPTPDSIEQMNKQRALMNPNQPVFDRQARLIKTPQTLRQMQGLDAVDDRGVPVFGGRDTPGARGRDGGPRYTPKPVGPGIPFDPSDAMTPKGPGGGSLLTPGGGSLDFYPGPADRRFDDYGMDFYRNQPIGPGFKTDGPPINPPAPIDLGPSVGTFGPDDGDAAIPDPDFDPTSLTVSPPGPVDTSPTETTPAPDTAPETTGTGTETAPATGGGGAQAPFAASVRQTSSRMDPITEQLLFGIGGQGGFIPGAMRAAEKTFYDDQGNPIVIDEKVADFSPDQLAAMQMQRQSVGMQDPYLQQAAGAYGAGTQALEEGLQRGRTAAIGALEATKGGVGSLQQGLGESADILRGTIGGYDPSMTDRFYDPYEDRVVQQTISDIMERGAKGDVAARAGDIARGGESAFGSRARLGASERQEALGRGLAEAVSGIRSRGFSEAQRTGLGEFARQKGAERAASAGLAGLAGQGFGGSQALAGALSGLGGTEQQIGQQRYSGQFGLGSSLQGLGAQAAGASASDIAALYGMGTQQQGQAQRMLDAQRRNLQQRQMTPLLQYQALQPFVSMAPSGTFQTTTDFVPPPSPLQAGLGVGLSTFGALGNLYGGGGGS
tara:strand:+ start:241 stop:3135 length:2895 start_codon:yes stop_codon:yes gene_type:complete